MFTILGPAAAPIHRPRTFRWRFGQGPARGEYPGFREWLKDINKRVQSISGLMSIPIIFCELYPEKPPLNPVAIDFHGTQTDDENSRGSAHRDNSGFSSGPMLPAAIFAGQLGPEISAV
jgi:hypothetical protein